MINTGMTTPLCGHCGRPAIAGIVYFGGNAYHYECTQSPSRKQTFEPVQLSAEQIRQIVREEMARLSAPYGMPNVELRGSRFCESRSNDGLGDEI